MLGEAEVPPGQYRAVRVTFDPDRSSMTDRDGRHPAIDWQAKGGAPSLFSLVEEPMGSTRAARTSSSIAEAGEFEL